eukprot:TRINITY_DN12626_c0_g1_i1.p1 TRINITY_DN12626_c0_g1~~TRINITY_DN12626_c0_g1_i1.p1  ORF type:complete len:525 (+),score=113.97 TRINITY_DN12626_c0_g1_i1:58-1632(+)
MTLDSYDTSDDEESEDTYWDDSAYTEENSEDSDDSSYSSFESEVQISSNMIMEQKKWSIAYLKAAERSDFLRKLNAENRFRHCFCEEMDELIEEFERLKEEMEFWKALTEGLDPVVQFYENLLKTNGKRVNFQSTGRRVVRSHLLRERTQMRQLFTDTQNHYLKRLNDRILRKIAEREQKVKIVEKKLNEVNDEGLYAWNWSLLGRDVISHIVSFIPRDDGNWLSLLLLNKEWNQVVKRRINPGENFYGEQPICYAIRIKSIDSLLSLLQDERVDLKSKWRYRKIPFELILKTQWEEGFDAFMACNRFSPTEYNIRFKFPPRMLCNRMYSKYISVVDINRNYSVDCCKIDVDFVPAILKKGISFSVNGSCKALGNLFWVVFDANMASWTNHHHLGTLITEAMKEGIFKDLILHLRKNDNSQVIKRAVEWLLTRASFDNRMKLFWWAENGMYFDEVDDDNFMRRLLMEPNKSNLKKVKFLLKYTSTKITLEDIKLCPTSSYRRDIKKIMENLDKDISGSHSCTIQ